MNLAEFQAILKKNKIEAYLVTRNNMFIGQDVLASENKVMELCGFSGSAGNLLVFQDKAVLFTDGRYELQAKQEVSAENVEVMISKDRSLRNCIGSYTYKQDHEMQVMYNPWCLTIGNIDFNKSYKKSFTFVEDKIDLLGPLLSPQTVHVFEHNIEYAGISCDEKISDILKILKKEQLDAYFFTAADSVSWLLNLRSDALPDSPVLRAFALVTKEGDFTLFGDNLDYPNIQPLSSLEKVLKQHRKLKLGLDQLIAPQKISLMHPDTVFIMDYIARKKAVKNPVEIQGMKNAHLRDAVALVNFLAWLEENWQGKTELDIVDKLYALRQEQALFYSNSFETIAAFGPNGAIVHYQPNSKTNLALQAASMLLLDSGGQYLDGTTDITRTIAIGSPTTEMIKDYTIVLKAHIALANSYFPTGSSGEHLDSICRHILWKQGYDYNHGTGHGVGCFLNVHEGPQNIGKKHSYKPFCSQMVTSIEPGYYKENAYGIRIENLYYVDEVAKELENPMLKFEPLTYVPIDKGLIDKYLLEQGDIDWLNNYHQKVWELISPLVDGEVKAWLESACSPL